MKPVREGSGGCVATALRALPSGRILLALGISLATAYHAEAAGKRGSQQRTVDCAVSQLDCRNRCPPWPAPDWPLCLTQCDIAYTLCLAEPDAEGSRTLA